MKTFEIFGKKVPVIAILIALLVIGTASAAVFLNYATLTGSVDVSNGISVTDGDGTIFEANGVGVLNFDSPAVFTINNANDEPAIVNLVTTLTFDNGSGAVPVTDFTGLTVDYSVIDGTDVEATGEGILVLVPPGGLTVEVEFDAVDNALPGEYNITVAIDYSNEDYETFTGDNAMQTLSLSNKDPNSNWQTYGNTATVDYVPMGNEFYYELSASGLIDVEHCLIYYADKENRMTNWGGESPGAIIATTTPTSGVIDINGTKALDMNLPHANDWNSFYYDYSGEPDYYGNAHGAKLWLVPSSQIDPSYTPYSTKLLTAWGPEMILFETELIHYTDTDL